MKNDFYPPFCPNVRCAFHLIKNRKVYANFYRDGVYVSRGRAFPKFRCHCGRHFSQRTFQFNFRFKKPDEGLSAKILKTFILGASNRQIGRHLKISERCVRGRIRRMSVWAMLIHREKITGVNVTHETICYDGLQNFAGSQFDPNYINQAIGKDSLFIYDFNFAPLNRKGRMSDRQKLKEAEIRERFGPYPKSAVQVATKILFNRLCRMQPKGETTPLHICSDEHYLYPRAIRQLPPNSIVHQTISSKATRNFQNILFAVNHIDLMIRHEVAAFSRETISFSKNHGSMCQKFALFMVYRNYMAPQFTKKQKMRPQANVISPAQAAGIERSILNFHELFACVRTVAQIEPPEDWKLFVRGQVPFPRAA